MIDQLREAGGMDEGTGSGSFGRALVSALRRVAILVIAVVGVLAVFGVLLWGCVTAVERIVAEPYDWGGRGRGCGAALLSNI